MRLNLNTTCFALLFVVVLSSIGNGTIVSWCFLRDQSEFTQNAQYHIQADYFSSYANGGVEEKLLFTEAQFGYFDSEGNWVRYVDQSSCTSYHEQLVPSNCVVYCPNSITAYRIVDPNVQGNFPVRFKGGYWQYMTEMGVGYGEVVMAECIDHEFNFFGGM